MYGVAKNWPWFKNDARVLQKLRRSYNKKSVTRLEVCSERNHIEPRPWHQDFLNMVFLQKLAVREN